MADGTTAPSGAAFGFPEPAPDLSQGQPDPLDDSLDTAAPQPQVEPQQQEQQPEPVSVPEGQQQSPPVQDGQQDGQTPTGDKKWAGAFDSPEKLEEGYEHIRRLQNRTAEQRKAAELRNQQLEAALQQLLAQRQPQAQPGVDFDPTDPAQVERLVEQRVQREAQQVRQQVQQEAVATSVNVAIDTFRARHPEVAPGTPLDDMVANIVEQLGTDEETGQFNPQNFPVTVESLETALELAQNPQLFQLVDELYIDPTDTALMEEVKQAAQNPSLAEVYRAQPELIEREAGRNWARKQAALPPIVATAQAQGQQPTPDEMRRLAHVETGGTGAPVQQAPGARPGDEFDEALDMYRNSAQASIFG